VLFRSADALGYIGRASQEMGVRVCYRPVAGTLGEHPDQLDVLMGIADPRHVLLALDTAHVALGGGNPATIFKAYVDRIGHVSFRDLTTQGTFAPLGGGILNLPSVYQILRDADYQGYIAVETETETDPRDCARIGMEYCSRVLGLLP